MTLLEDRTEPELAQRRSGLATVLGVVVVVGVLVIAVTAGYLWGRSSGPSGISYPAVGSVDAGFARDMSVHHAQAITMASYAEVNSTDDAIKALAYDIETSQSVQRGEMIGWLNEWGISPNYGRPMDWMPTSAMHGMTMAASMTNSYGTGGALMPGMATTAQMNRLQSAHGTALNVLFLQLMIRHHQGGLPMARYAATHASLPAVRQLAQNITVTQTREIGQMTAMLKSLGGSPLPPPS